MPTPAAKETRVTSMESHLRLAADQLARMRGMNADYHRRFFGDIRFTLLVGLGLLVAGYAVERGLMLVIPFVALLGACQTAFDASYLIFSRHYAAALERYLNREVGREVLLGARMEDAYLFPLDRTKVVTVPVGRGFSWFSFMTILYTLLGVAAYGAGLVLGAPALAAAEPGATIAYSAVLGGSTMAALLVGGWWFLGGVGERRLRDALSALR